jgi:hypothetical protein
MKYFSAAILILFLVSMFYQTDNPYLSEAAKSVNNILSSTAKIIKKKYKIKPSGVGAAMPEGIISELTLAFNTNDQFSKQDLRKLLIECAHELVAQVYLNGKIEPFLKAPPFSIKNVQIIIYNNDQLGRDVYDPEISTAEISSGILTYRTTDPIDSFRFKNEFQETYEEALKMISQ